MMMCIFWVPWATFFKKDPTAESMQDQTLPPPNPFALVFCLLRRHSHTELQPSTPSPRSPRSGVASGSLARQTRWRCQRRRNKAGRRDRRQCWYPTCCRPCLPGAEHTALTPQNWMPPQGKASVRICHLTLREVRASLSVFASSPRVLSFSSCMSSSSTFRLSSCHSHCKAFIHGLQKQQTVNVILIFVTANYKYMQQKIKLGFCSHLVWPLQCLLYLCRGIEVPRGKTVESQTAALREHHSGLRDTAIVLLYPSALYTETERSSQSLTQQLYESSKEND